MNSITTYAVRLAKQGNVDVLAKDWLDSLGGAVPVNGQETVEGQETAECQRPDKDKPEILKPSDKPQAVANDINPPEDMKAEEMLRFKDEYIREEYDENNNLTCKIEREDDDSIKSITKYQYGENGKMTLQTQYCANGKVKYYDKYEYTDDNNKIFTRYNSDGTVDYIVEYVANGNRIKETGFNSDGTKEVTEYGADGNQTKVTKYDKDGKQIQ